jgi:imidazolonepropionase-like amidohydrolase
MDAEKEGEPGILKMDPAIIRAACEEAHRLGFPVAAHVESTEGVVEALRGGVDTIEHGAMPTDEMAELFKQRGSCLITTISPVLPLALLDIQKTHVRPMDRYNAGIVLRGIIECSRMALREGIPVGLGTDAGCPFVTQYDMWRELAYFHNFCGVSNAYALHTATLGNAKIAGIDQETGSIEIGKSADFLVTAGNPLEKLRALRRPHMVVIRGEEIAEPGSRKDGEIERTLDELLQVTYEDLDRLLGEDSRGGLAE